VAEKAIKSLEGAGVFAVELFLTEDDQVFLDHLHIFSKFIPLGVVFTSLSLCCSFSRFY
jgi:hypothetical protein